MALLDIRAVLMVRTRLATGLSLLGAASILYIGIGYLLAPSTRDNTPKRP
ncbi:hypothetical protein AB4305_16080 [Nocardia sp. 2YAB30]